MSKSGRVVNPTYLWSHTGQDVKSRVQFKVCLISYKVYTNKHPAIFGGLCTALQEHI